MTVAQHGTQKGDNTAGMTKEAGVGLQDWGESSQLSKSEILAS